jgi:hypothetical protein
MSDACDCCTLGSVSIDIIVVWIWHAWSLWPLHPGIQTRWCH